MLYNIRFEIYRGLIDRETSTLTRFDNKIGIAFTLIPTSLMAIRAIMF